MKSFSQLRNDFDDVDTFYIECAKDDKTRRSLDDRGQKLPTAPEKKRLQRTQSESQMGKRNTK